MSFIETGTHLVAVFWPLGFVIIAERYGFDAAGSPWQGLAPLTARWSGAAPDFWRGPIQN